MTRIFEESGKSIPVTVIQCAPSEITQVKTVEKDGYQAVVIGYSPKKHPTKTKKFSVSKEFKVDEKELGEMKKGDLISLESIKDISLAKVSSLSKGKGFQGVIKRHNFSRGPESHGSHHHREPGSVGACAKPGRVSKGKKLPGRMGAAKVTLQKVKVAYLDLSKNIICLKGAVPGPNGGVVSICKQA